jgi:hypothetical protein
VRRLLLIVTILVGCVLITMSAVPKDVDDLFPQMEGWEKKGNPAVYTPDTLYEYINGAADVYLSYDFQQLATMTFENAEKHSFTVDIYQHADAVNGFGIYTQERPQTGPFLTLGTQGYYEQGVLNFLKGSYYVKLSGFDLGDDDKTVLTEAASRVAEKLSGEKSFPHTAGCFPQKGKVDYSERYIAKNFMGHAFLHSAFVADYKVGENKFQVFIIETDNEEETGKILENYLAFAKGKGKSIETPEKDVYRFQDPYYRSSGMMNLKRKGKHLWGLLSKTPETAAYYIGKIEEKLIKAE